ncbi:MULTISPECIES: hypothetical protein [unclassified Legionella]|uniref:hypothetical protein n=1 Tax=unclassified Legionella TaxID=2622702 RepID=UPI001E440A8B|nr:hypothetical protein [Legionella sp. 31fI33]MCC5013820.1 hypothetical protein [Legionella sp. 31fI33]
MRRMIQFKGDKLDVLLESVGGALLTFEPLFSVTVTGEKVSLQLSPIAKGYYELPNLSVKEQISYLLTCLTRAEIDEQTDMHKVVNAFIDHSLEKSTDLIIFTRTGYRADAEPVDEYQTALTTT